MHNRVKVSPTLFQLKQGTLIERLPECTLLFAEQDQQIHELNETSAVMAQRLVAGASEKELVGALLSRGAETEAAAEWARAFLQDLARMGLLEAAQMAPIEPAAMQKLRVQGQPLTLSYGSLDLERLLAGAFVHLQATETKNDEGFDLSGDGDLVFIAGGNGPASVTPLVSAAVRLKGLILERALDAPGHVAALHAACLERGGKGLLLLGSPGEGKTTLSLALMELGFRYGSDDVTLVKPDGRVEGVPLAPAVKEGAWELTRHHDLAALPIHLRPDGQPVRYVSLRKEALAGQCQVGAVLRLRRDGHQPALLEPISAKEGLAELFRESRSADGRCSTIIMRALAELIRGADCFELRYSDAAAAASLVFERMGG